MKRLLGLIATLSLLVTALPASSAPWVFSPTQEQRQNENTYEIQESYSVGNPSSVAIMTRRDGSLRKETCLELGVAPCTTDLLQNFETRDSSTPKDQSTLDFDLTMPSCEAAIDKTWCIEEVRVYAEGSSRSRAQFLRQIEGPTTAALPELGIPGGGTMPIYKFTDLSQFADLGIAVFANTNMQNVRYSSTSRPSYQPMNLIMQAIPFRTNPNRVRPFPLQNISQTNPGLVSLGVGESDCVWQDSQGCGERIDFPAGFRIGVTIRTDLPVAEFFNGRLDKAEVSVTKTGKTSRISIDAMPIVVPEVAVSYPESSGLRAQLGTPTRGGALTLAYFDNAFKAISVLRDFVGDKASGENTYWRLTSVGIIGERCYQGTSFAGMVLTNATAYSGMNPPPLVNGFIDYRVAGMHHLSDGKTEFLGSYSLILRSEVARCLYNYTNAPISATVSVLGSGGEQKVASTTVTERNGWLTLEARGFGFSENKIRTRITQRGTVATPAGASRAPLSLPNFAGNVTRLSAAQLAAIRSWTLPAAKTVKCIGLGTNRTSAQSAIALARAKNVCAELKKRNRALRTSVASGVGQGISLRGAVITEFR